MYDVYGVQAATYEEACIVAGCDTPAQIEAEMQWCEEMNAAEAMKLDVLSGLRFAVKCLCKAQQSAFIGPINAPDWAEYEIPF